LPLGVVQGLITRALLRLPHLKYSQLISQCLILSLQPHYLLLRLSPLLIHHLLLLRQFTIVLLLHPLERFVKTLLHIFLLVLVGEGFHGCLELLEEVLVVLLRSLVLRLHVGVFRNEGVLLLIVLHLEPGSLTLHTINEAF
jgi:hypothetical protein